MLFSAEADGSLSARADEVLERFFSDFARDKIEDYKNLNLKQGTVHKVLADGKAMPVDLGGKAKTAEVGDAVLTALG